MHLLQKKTEIKKSNAARFSLGILLLVFAMPFVGLVPAQATSTATLAFNVNASDSGSYSPSSPTVWNDLAGGQSGNIIGSLSYNSGTQAMVFPGGANSTYSSGYVDMGSGLSNFSSGLSIEFESHFGAANQSWERIFDFGNGAGADNIWVGVVGVGAANRLAIEIWNDSLSPKNLPGRCVSPSNALISNQFAKWVITLDGSTCRMYKNGTEINVERIDGGFGSTLAGPSTGVAYPYLPRNVTRTNNYIGRSNWGSDPAFDGAIKYVRIYSSAISGTDAANNAATYTLTYAATGADSGSAPAARTGNGLITLDGNTGSLAKNGYTFAGWASTSGSSTAISGSYNLITNVTLHPVWSANSYTVTYDSHGGSSVSAGSYTTGSTISLPPAPTLSGYTFAGWFVSASSGSALGATYSPPGTGAITLHAQWTVNTTTTTSTTSTTTTTTTIPPTTTTTTSTSSSTTTSTVAISSNNNATPITTTTIPTTVQSGSMATVTVGGFLPSESVLVTIDAVGLNKRYVANTQGQVRFRVRLTAGQTSKLVTVKAVSASANVTKQVKVVASAGYLPRSGSSAWAMFFFASLAFLVGHLIVQRPGSRRI